MTEKRRTALVTGSSRNVGRAIALALAKDGMNVVVNGVKDKAACQAVAEETRSHGVDTISVMADVGDQAAAEGLAKQAIDHFGAVDVFIHCASTRPRIEFLNVTDDDWNHVFATTLFSAFWISRALVPGMAERGWGRIVLFSGLTSIRGYPFGVHNCASKHGLWGMIKGLAHEFGPQGITSNIISPGPTVAGHDEKMTAHISGLGEKTPVGRAAKPEEMTAVVSMLVSDNGAFVNGQQIQVNGGAVT